MGKCYNTAVINAPLEKVWATLRKFHDLSWATGVVTKAEAVGDVPGDQVGAKRILNGAFHETLKTLDDPKHFLAYGTDDGPGPVARDAVKNYVSRVSLLPVTENNTTFIAWQSSFESANEQAVSDFCNPLQQAALQALKKHFSS